jgi:galactokinase
LLIECATGRTRQIPVRGRLLLVDTGVRHELAAGALNTRQAECEAALRTLTSTELGLEWLADWPETRLGELRRLLSEPLRSRAMHVVTETARTRVGATLLTQGKLRAFGRLLYASHESCRRHFECSSPELDLVVRVARRAGAWGARLTGAGWGGAVLVLVGPADAAEGTRERAIVDAVRRAFMRTYQREPVITAVRPGDGARRERIR